MQQHLRVAARAKAHAVALERRPQLEVVEDLPVLHDADRSMRREHRLIAVLEVDDRQPARGQTDGAVEVATVAVGSSVDQGCVHARNLRAVRGPAPHEVIAAANAAHGLPASAPSQGRRLSTARRFAGRTSTSHTVVAITER